MNSSNIRGGSLKHSELFAHSKHREFPLFTVLLCAVSGILKNWNDSMKMAKEPCQGFGIYVLNHELWQMLAAIFRFFKYVHAIF